MSGESALHAALVAQLSALLESDFAQLPNFVLYTDTNEANAERPPYINGHLPDVFAHDVPNTFRIIGEAKTPKDLRSDRSARQILCFLDWLSVFDDSRFYLAVPPLSAPLGRAVLAELSVESHGQVETAVVELRGTFHC